MCRECFQLAHEGTQQCGLARAVETEHEQAFTAADLEGDVLEHDLGTERLREVDDLERDPARVRRFGQLYAQRAISLAELDAVRIQLLDPPVERLGDARPLLGLMAHRVGERAQAPDLRLLTGRDLRPARLVSLARDEVLRVGASVLDDLALVEVQDARDRLVEQCEVVTDDEQRPAKRPQERHQPGFGVDVEVVRGLVEEHEVAAREEDPSQLGPSSLAARKRADRQIESIGRETEAGDDPPHLGFGRVTPARGERVLRVGVRLHVAGRRIGVDPRAQFLEPSEGCVETAPRQHVRERRAVEADPAGGRVLREEAHRLGTKYDSVRGRRRARQHLEQ